MLVLVIPLVVTYEMSNAILSVGTLAKDWPTALKLDSAILEGYPIGCNICNIQHYIASGTLAKDWPTALDLDSAILEGYSGTLLVVTYEISNVILSVGTLAKDWPTALELDSAILEGYPIGFNILKYPTYCQ